MANCLEALLAALFLDGGLEVADDIFGRILFNSEGDLRSLWFKCPSDQHKHPIQEQLPEGDRHLIKCSPRLTKLLELENMTGVTFTHIRLLARALTSRSYNILTLGSNQRMEFLGDTVLQLLASHYLYKFFPRHHEGHLSLLRSSLVNNKTQDKVCRDLGLDYFCDYDRSQGNNQDEAQSNNPLNNLKTKDRADLLEAFLGALFVDKGLMYCRTFCQVAFFPRLKDFILNMEWNDPKSRLQQSCLTLRDKDKKSDPDIPVYKVIETIGPTNTRDFRVAVKFQGKRLSVGKGHSIQEAEMDAALKALEVIDSPQLRRQNRIMKKRRHCESDRQMQETMEGDVESGTL
jgi:ribonuclease-3